MRLAVRSLVLALALVALTPPAAAGERGGEPLGIQRVRVRIVDNAFRPGRLTIERGTVVRWVNRGSNNHTTTSNTDLWDSGTLVPGDAFRRRFRRVGTFRYHCEIHAGMTARIIVTS